MTNLKDVYLTIEAFNKDLDECLTIIEYPSKTKPFYVCENISSGLHKRKVNVHISN